MINEIGEIRPNNTAPVLMMEKYFGEEGRIDRKNEWIFYYFDARLFVIDTIKAPKRNHTQNEWDEPACI
jgi:hypothetical protein